MYVNCPWYFIGAVLISIQFWGAKWLAGNPGTGDKVLPAKMASHSEWEFSTLKDFNRSLQVFSRSDHVFVHRWVTFLKSCRFTVQSTCPRQQQLQTLDCKCNDRKLCAYSQLYLSCIYVKTLAYNRLWAKGQKVNQFLFSLHTFGHYFKTVWDYR